MTRVNQKGFTIIEVVLFLALSGLFLMVAFIGVRGRTAAVQFTDSMRSVQSFLVSEQNKVLNGVNSSLQAPDDCGSSVSVGESNNCVLVGRVVRFGKTAGDQTEVVVDVLFGSKPSSNDVTNKDDYTLLDESDPRKDESMDAYNISWGTEFNVSLSMNSDNTNDTYDSIGWLRSPGSTRLIPIAYNSSVGDLTSVTADYYRQSSSSTRLGDQVETRLCFTGSSGQVASVRFGDGTGSSGTDVVFDDPECST